MLLVASVLESSWIIWTAIKSLTIITGRCHKLFKTSAWFVYIECIIFLMKISKSLLNCCRGLKCIEVPRNSFWGSTLNWKKNRVIKMVTNQKFWTCTVLWPLKSNLWYHPKPKQFIGEAPLLIAILHSSLFLLSQCWLKSFRI